MKLDGKTRLHMYCLQRNYMIKLLIQKIKSYLLKRSHIRRMKKLRKLDPFIYD